MAGNAAQIIQNAFQFSAKLDAQKEQALRDDSFRRDKMAEATRQYNMSFKEGARQFDDTLQYKYDALQTQKDYYASLSAKAENLKEKDKLLGQARQEMITESEQRKAHQQQTQQTYDAFNAAVNKGNMVDISPIILGDNVDPELVNEARGNSGRGAGIFIQRGEDGRNMLFTKDKETGEFLPMTSDPENNESPQLYLDDSNRNGILHSVGMARENIAQQDGTGSLMSAFMTGGMGLHTYKDGRVTTKGRFKAEEQAKAEVAAQNKVIDEQNAKRQKQWEDEQRIKNGGVVPGREGGAVDEALAGVDADSIGNLLPGMKSIKNGLGAIADSDLAGKAVDFMFGKENQDPAKAEELKEKIKDKPPEMRERIVLDEYLKQNTSFTASERRSMTKLRSGSEAAINATRAKRVEIARKLVKADPSISQGAIDNYIETGTLMSKADLQAPGIKTKQALLDIQKTEAEIAKTMSEAGGSMDGGDFMKMIMPSISTATDAWAYGDSEQKEQTAAQYAGRFATFFQNTGIRPKAGFGTHSFVDTAIKVDQQIQSAFRSQGFEVDSIAPAILYASGNGRKGQQETVEEFATKFIQAQKATGMSTEQIVAQGLRENGYAAY